MFNKINCDRGAIDDMLGAQAGVSDQNMLQYLGIIEQRTNELLAVRDYQSSKVGKLQLYSIFDALRIFLLCWLSVFNRINVYI